MATKAITVAVYTLIASYNGRRYSAYPGGNFPVVVPFVAFTDVVTGPTSSGENNLGCYLTLYGYNFGAQASLGNTVKVYVGGAEVANYRYLVGAKVSGKFPGLKALCVQVGSLGGAANGTALTVEVRVAGISSNTNWTFTPCAGAIYFASLAGSEGNAGTIGAPRRYLQTTDGAGLINGGISTVQGPGDHIIIRGGDWSDAGGHSTCWYRFRYPGQQGTNLRWVHFTAYPGPILGHAPEDVHYSTPSGMKGGIHGPNSAYIGTTGEYVSISNMRFEVSPTAAGDAGPCNLQYGAGPWRVTNMELGPWMSTVDSRAAGVAGHGFGTKVLGCYIHDFNCSGSAGLLNHGIYMDSPESTATGVFGWEIAYNWIKNIPGGNLVQCFDNLGSVGATWHGFDQIKIHHNYLDTCGKYGLNLNGLVSADIYNNIVIGATYSGLRMDVAYPGAAWAIKIAFNTFYNNDQLTSGSGNAQVLNDNANGTAIGGSIQIKNNIFAAGPNTITGSGMIALAGGFNSYFAFDQNVYYGSSQGWTTQALDANAKFADPQFVSSSTGDFTPGSAGSAYNAATITPLIAVSDDIIGTARPVGSNRDIGAVERTT